MKPTAISLDPKPEERFGNTMAQTRPGLLDGKPATGAPAVTQKAPAPQKAAGPVAEPAAAAEEPAAEANAAE